MVMLKALEAAINQVETIHAHELTFTVDGQTITLRPLRSHEETEVQRYAQAAWEGMSEDGDTAAYQDFMDRVRVSTLGFSVVRLGDMDLHGVDWIETGEFDEHGNPISVPKSEAVRDLIREQWSKSVALQVFAKFGELLERVEIHASKLVKFDPADLDAEIDRVEKRLADLKLKREEKKPPDQSPIQKAQKAVLNVDQQHQAARNRIRSNAGQNASAGHIDDDPEVEHEADHEAAEDTSPQPPQAPQPRREPAQAPQAAPPRAQQQPSPQPPRQPPREPAPPQGRRSAVPQEAAPPERPPAVDDEAVRANEREQEEALLDEQGFALPHDGDSFFDPSDPDAAMAAEAKRQAQLHAHNLRRQREQKMARQRAEAMGMPSREELARQAQQRQRDTGRPQATRLDPRTEGLRQAANLQDQVFDTGVGRQQTGRPQRAQPQPAGSPQAPATLHGKPVYKMPAQILDKPARQRHAEAVEREHGEPPPGPVQINPAAGGRQTKFRGPGNG